VNLGAQRSARSSPRAQRRRSSARSTTTASKPVESAAA
jgi:hypothetical protein